MSEKSIEEIYEIYGEMLYKISLVMLKNTHDAEDVVQNVMIKYMTKELHLILQNMKRHG